MESHRVNSMLRCGSFVRDTRRKRRLTQDFILTSEEHEEKPVGTPPYISITYPVSQSHIYQTPLVHDSPVTRAQSNIEDLVLQTAPLLGTRCYLRNSS